ncbi:MAG: hypothetical protein GY811_24350 [Myxococcales bacterium]|nr:hypothetical protein [Myxococcales bacterium]
MRAPMILLLCSPLLAGSTWLLQNDGNVAKGQEAFRTGDFALAASHFRKAMGGAGNRDVLQFDLGTALAEQGRLAQDSDERARLLRLAIVALRSAKDTSDVTLRRDARFNTGNAELLAERYEEAIESYKVILREDPFHESARHNLELAQLLHRSEVSLGDVGENQGDNSSGAESGGSEKENTESGLSNGGEETQGAGQGGGDATGESGAGDGEGLGAEEAGDGAEDARAMRAEPRAISGPGDVDDGSVTQKLEALERRSGELRRIRVLHRTQKMVRRPRRAEKGR